METSTRFSDDSRSGFSEDAKKRPSAKSGSSSNHPSEGGLLVGTPFHAAGGTGMGQSEVDLNERLILARKNSKSMAALSPKPSGARKLGSKSVAELRSQVEQRQTCDQAEAALRDICESVIWGIALNFSAFWFASADVTDSTLACG